MALRAIGGTLLVISFVLFTFNVFATIVKRKPQVLPVQSVKPAAAN